MTKSKQINLSTPVVKELFDIWSFTAEGKRHEFPSPTDARTISLQIDRRILVDAILDICESKKFVIEKTLYYDDNLKLYRSGRFLFIDDIKTPLVYLTQPILQLVLFLDTIVLPALNQLKKYGFVDLCNDIDVAIKLVQSFMTKYDMK